MKQVICAVLALAFSFAASAAPKKVKCEFRARGDRDPSIINGTLDGTSLTITELDLLPLDQLNENPVEVPNLKSFVLSTMSEAGDSGERLEVGFSRGLHRGTSIAEMDYIGVDMNGDLPAVNYRGSCFLSDRN